MVLIILALSKLLHVRSGDEEYLYAEGGKKEMILLRLAEKSYVSSASV